MSAPTWLANVEAVRRAMQMIDAASRARGDSYVAQGRVHGIEGTESGETFTASVQGTRPYQVSVEIEGDRCTASCTCPVGSRCKHIYAVLKTLVVEHVTAEVQRLSSTQVPVRLATTAGGPRPAGKRGPFPEEVRNALGRRLKRDEQAFLENLNELYAGYRNAAAIPSWVFEELGFQNPSGRFSSVRLPAPPTDLGQFWQFIAYVATEWGSEIPEFLRPVTDPNEAAELFRRLHRKEEVSRWKKAFQQTSTSAIASAAQQVDFRARFGPSAVILEHSSEGGTFTPLRATSMRELLRRLDRGESVMTPEAEWLWEIFQSSALPGGSPELRYNELGDRRALSRLLRLPLLRSRLVDDQGEPLAFHAEPLRWELVPPQDAEDDYRVRLVQPGSDAVPKIHCLLPGRPTLYLTSQGVFEGPEAEGTPLDPRQENRIPAAAIETREGVAVLHALGIALPPALAARVTIIPVKLRVVCELRESFPGSEAELCHFELSGITADGGEQHVWNGTSWQQSSPAPRAGNGSRALVVFDTSRLPSLNSLMLPLNAKWLPFDHVFTVRVTKKFPELFMPWLKTLPPDAQVELRGELQSLLNAPVSGEVRLDVQEADIDWFDLRVVLNVSDTTLSDQELKLLLNARGGYVRLKDKGWRRLEFKLSEEENEHLARLGLSPGQLSGEPQRLHALQLADKAARRFLGEEQYERIERRASELKARVSPEIPSAIKAELRPYQRDGYHFLAYLAENRFGGILADDMGLGKTLQTLTWLEWVRGNSPKRVPSLVVCPKSVMDNWRAEAERFSPGISVKVWSPDDLPQLLERAAEFDMHVINYNQLRSLGEGLKAVRWLALILDEGQYIKNPSSVTAQVARSLRAEHRLVLSGTPIENRLLDLWSLMAFAMPGVLGSRTEFARLYDSKEDPLARRRLSARVRPFLLRRTKEQVAKDLPDRVEEDLLCEIEGEQQTLYRAELKRAQQMLLRLQTDKQLAKERFHVLTSLLRLRQICCHPRLLKPDSKAPSAKVEALMEQVEPLMDEGHKVLVFSQFVQMLDILKDEIATRGWPTYYLSGDTENRGELVKQFQSAEGGAVFLISLKAGGFGLNLTAASYVVLFDPWWNPAVENQAIDRTHRIGQQRNVIAYRLLIKNSVEEKIRALQQSKSALAEDVLGEEKFAQALTLDDLRFLFSDQP